MPKATEFEEGKVYVIKHATLMSQGVWNGNYYDKEEIAKAFNNTDWSDRSKLHLFLDHNDKNMAGWIGHVRNPSFEGDSLYGDVVVSDPNWAYNIKYGKPKFGISPKVIGGTDENKNIRNFTFENFSFVTNPAVKTTYINNMEVLELSEEESKETDEYDEDESYDGDEDELAEISAFEAKRKAMGMTPSQFYAIPKEPPSASKLPIYDAAHTRNALARINQVKGVSSDEMAKAKKKVVAAAKKFGVKVSEKMGETEGVSEERLKELMKEELEAIQGSKKEVDEKMDGLSELFELYELKGLSLTGIVRKADELKAKEKELSYVDAVKKAAKLQEDEKAKEEEEKPKEDAPKEEKPAEGEEKPEAEAPAEAEAKMKAIESLEKKVKELSEKLNEPATKTLKKVDEKPSSTGDVDNDMLHYLQEFDKEVTQYA